MNQHSGESGARHPTGGHRPGRHRHPQQIGHHRGDPPDGNILADGQVDHRGPRPRAVLHGRGHPHRRFARTHGPTGAAARDDPMRGHHRTHHGQLDHLPGHHTRIGRGVKNHAAVRAGPRRVNHDTIRVGHLSPRRPGMAGLAARLLARGAPQRSGGRLGQPIGRRRLRRVPRGRANLPLQLGDPGILLGDPGPQLRVLGDQGHHKLHELVIGGPALGRHDPNTPSPTSRPDGDTRQTPSDQTAQHPNPPPEQLQFTLQKSMVASSNKSRADNLTSPRFSTLFSYLTSASASIHPFETGRTPGRPQGAAFLLRATLRRLDETRI